MMKKIAISFICLSLLAVLGNGQGVAERDYRHTPFGLKHKACILEVPSGTHVEATTINGVEHVHLLHPNGTSRLHSKCPHNDPAQQKRAAPTWNGWPQHYWYGTDYAYFTNPALNSPVTSFEATWNVPNFPANRAGNPSAPWPNQPTLSWWTGLQSPNFGDVLQPVLEFNGLLSNAYDLASWNCCPAGYTFHSTPISVSPGQTASGLMDLVTASDPYTYRIVSQVVGGASTTLVANLSAAKPNVLWSEVKNEGYFVTNCNQLPQPTVNFKINKFTTHAGTVNVNTIPWKQGYQCEGATCPSAALSPSCQGSATQNQNTVSIGFK